MNVPFVNFAKEYEVHQEEYDRALYGCIKRGDLILRKDVEEFERNLADYVGTKYAVAVASGTDALILSLKAAGIKEGDKVITSSYTFRATIEAIVHAGGVPILADKGQDWKEVYESGVKFIIPCHLEGAVMDWKPDKRVTMIEDACQAIGAAPVTGITACYSFYPAKILGCLGDGGAIATDSKEVYEHLKKMRNHYKDDWSPVGYNSRLDNLQAAFLNVRIGKLPNIVKSRLVAARIYDQILTDKVERPEERQVYQDYIITLKSEKERDELHDYLTFNGIQTLKNGYPFPSVVKKKPKAIAYEKRSLRLPCNETLTQEQIYYVCDKINKFYE